MASFAEFIAENFHSEADLIWRLDGPARAVAAFKAGSLSVEVAFEQRETNGPWHVAFDVVTGDPTERTSMAFRVFNGVFQAVRDFIGTRQPAIVVFISKNDDLAGIYGTYLRREKNAIESMGYILEGPHRVEPYTEYTLRRARPADWREP